MSDELLKNDWYNTLGCTMEDTKEQINKASRKLSLKYHPDKNPSKSAEAMFLQIQKAKEILLDDTARLEYDTALRKVSKRKIYDDKRKGQMDASKKRMRDELEERMKSATAKHHSSSAQHTTESVASKRAREQDIHSLRQENMARMESHHEENIKRDEEFRRQVADATARRQQATEHGTDDVSLCLKVKWRKNDFDQSEESVVHVFKQFGLIECVQFGGSKGSSAIIVFSHAASVQKAIEGMDQSTIYKVSRVEAAKSTIFNHVYDNSSGKKFAENGHVGGDTDGLMSHIRRAVERDQLLRNFPSSDQQQPSIIPSEDINSANKEKPKTAFAFKANAPAFPVMASQLKEKENDILKKMLEAAALKKGIADAPSSVPPVESSS